MADYEVIGSNPVQDYEVIGVNTPPKSLFQKAITPLASSGYIRKEHPIVSALGATIPIMRSISGVPGSAILQPNLLEQGAEEMSAQTSPAAIGSNLLALPQIAREVLPAVTKASLAKTAPGRFITKPRQIPDIRELGVFKQGRDFISEKLAKPAAEYVKQHIKNFPDSAKKTLGLRDETVALLKQHGYEKVANPTLAHEEADQAFKTALSNKTTVYGDKIDIRKTLSKMQSAYDNIKRVDPNNPLGRMIDDIKKLIPAPKGFYTEGGKLPTATQLTRQFRGEPLNKIAGEVRVSRTELSMLRDKLNNLYKERGFDRKVFEIVDSLYQDAEKAGIKGIHVARKLKKEAYQFDKVQSNLGKIEKIDSQKIFTDLNSVVNDSKKYQIMVDKYSPYMGIDKAQQLFRQALSVRHGKQFLKTAGVVSGLATAGNVGRSIIGSLKKP